MSRILVCIVMSLFFLGCARKKHEAMNSSEIYMVVGTYTNSGSHGIYVCRFDTINGNITVDNVVKQDNPSFLCHSANKKFIYSICEEDNFNAGITAYSFSDGKLDKLNEVSGLGSSPCYISTNGSEVAVAEYGGGSFSRFGLNQDGTLGFELEHRFYRGNGADPKSQASSHLHSTQYSPDNYLYITDLGCDNMYILKDGVEVSTIDFEPNFGPRHFTFSKDRNYMYVIGELSGKLCVAKRDSSTYKPIQYILSYRSPDVNGKGSADIHMSPDGKFIYTSNRLKDDGIAIFKIMTDGKVANVGYMSTGMHPRNFAISEDGRWVIVACKNSNTIEVYSRNAESGMLIPHKERTINSIKEPVCIMLL